MNRYREAIARYAGAVPQPFAIYRAPIIGGGSLLPFEAGIASYQLTADGLEATKTVEEVGTFLTEITARSNELEAEYNGRTFDVPAQEEFASLHDLRTAAISRQKEFEARRAWIAELSNEPKRQEPVGHSLALRPNGGSRLPDNLFDLHEYRGRTTSEDGMVALMRDGARKVAEQAFYPHERATKDKSVERIERLFETTYAPEGMDAKAILARHILATGSPAYMRAWGKTISGIPLTTEERAAIATVGTTTTGGYAVPFTLDPTIILTSDGAVNPMRQVARTETTVGNTWKGVTSAGVTASYKAEAAATTDGAPTLGQPEVTVRKATALIKFSIESDQDWARLQAEMARLLQDAKDTLEADKFINGAGSASNEPEGVVAGLATSSLVGTTGDGFDLEDVDRLIGALPDRFEPRARFVGHRAVFTEVERAQRALGGGDVYRAFSAGQPATLLGYPRHNASEMESDFTTDGNEILLFGDFNAGFLIVDKIGLTVELIPHMVNGDGNPTGERGLYAYWRNSSVVLVDNALRLLRVGVVAS